VSDVVTLTARGPIMSPLEADCLTPDRLATLNESAIAALPLWSGREQQTVGDWFDVRGGLSSAVRIVGDVRHLDRLGSGMTTGELIIDGDAGSRLGAGMAGGRIVIHGSAGDDVGIAMTGGAIHVRGNAGARVGSNEPGAARGMTGGEIVIEGSVETDLGARMRRGLIVIGGSAGDRAARAMIAGTVVVMGDAGAESAHGSKRGTLVVGGSVDVPATYRYACTYDAPHVRLALTHVGRRYGMPIDARFTDRPYRRFCGDAGTVARGEILWLT
jgi:formylmethanofuran dehydrogenase subunit C